VLLAKLQKVVFSFLYCFRSCFLKNLHLLHSVKINSRFMYPILTSQEGINNERWHLTANTSAAKLDFG
jgi:hypothetical protein